MIWQLWFQELVEGFIYLLVAGIDRDIGQSRMKGLPCVVKSGLSHLLSDLAEGLEGYIMPRITGKRQQHAHGQHAARPGLCSRQPQTWWAREWLSCFISWVCALWWFMFVCSISWLQVSSEYWFLCCQARSCCHSCSVFCILDLRRTDLVRRLRSLNHL